MSEQHERPRAIRIAILALGGEGGGILADWIVGLAEQQRYVAQLTSVPGVAQRTGATVYYLELFPEVLCPEGHEPVLALAPVPGDVDIVIASELMEAARAVQRGIVTPDRTTLIASSGRVYAISERTAMGDGRANSEALAQACASAAKRFVRLDMGRIADMTGSVISAAMFGALAGSGALPFDRAAFEQTIEGRGVGVAASKRAFAMAYAAAQEGATEIDHAPVETSAGEKDALARAEAAVRQTLDTDGMPQECLDIIARGFARLVDYQDAAYARLYLQRLSPVVAQDRARHDGGYRLTQVVARRLAVGMAFLDPIRVAELKLRKGRAARITGDVRLRQDQILKVDEFLHPRLEEIAETVPAPLGRFIRRNGLARGLVGALTSSGRIVSTTSILGFALMAAIAWLKPHRRSSLRFGAEQRHLESWLTVIAERAQTDYGMAVELAECLGLVQGFGATHERGMNNFNAILDHARTIAPQDNASAKILALRKAAVADEKGQALGAALATK
jgi:indolepyruvate ferredoxin oxidoreductase beta subunit